MSLFTCQKTTAPGRFSLPECQYVFIPLIVFSTQDRISKPVFISCKYFYFHFTKTCFSEYITHCSVNFIWFTLLECSPMARETWVQSQVESYQRLKKWYLLPLCLTLSNIRYGSRVKCSNPGKEVEPSSTPRCSSYWKRSLRVTLDYGRQLYLLTLFSQQNFYDRPLFKR